MSVTFDGVDKMVGNLKVVATSRRAAMGDALFYEMKYSELPEVQARTPVDTGALVASEHAEGPFEVGSKVSATIVAGGPTAPYAVYVHEDLDAIHPVGEAKFVESVLKESKSFMAARVAARMRETLKRVMYFGETV